MKHKTVLFTALLLAATPLVADGLLLRYRALPTVLTISLTHDIRAGDADVPVGRTLVVELAVERGADAFTATIERLRATYSAHDVEERVSNGHLLGLGFDLIITADGRSVEPTPEGPVVDLGGFQEGGLELAAALAGWLPELPERPVEVGSSWSTTATRLSLEGWAWERGSLVSRHSVLAVDETGGRSIVTVESTGSGRLVPAAGDDSGEVGALELTGLWRFDVTSGRLVSASFEQRSDGVNRLAKGQLSIRQTTAIELSEGR